MNQNKEAKSLTSWRGLEVSRGLRFEAARQPRLQLDLNWSCACRRAQAQAPF